MVQKRSVGTWRVIDGTVEICLVDELAVEARLGADQSSGNGLFPLVNWSDDGGVVRAKFSENKSGKVFKSFKPKPQIW